MKDYIDIDEFGIKEIRCMNCGATVAARGYVDMPSNEEEGKTEKVMAFQRWSNWAQVKVDLEDGSYANPIVCADCVNREVDLNKVSAQMAVGEEKSMKFQGKDPKEIKWKMENYRKAKKIKRRAA